MHGLPDEFAPRRHVPRLGLVVVLLCAAPTGACCPARSATGVDDAVLWAPTSR